MTSFVFVVFIFSFFLLRSRGYIDTGGVACPFTMRTSGHTFGVALPPPVILARTPIAVAPLAAVQHLYNHRS